MSAEFVANMEDVLDLYAEPYDPQRPVVCFDETQSDPVVTAGVRFLACEPLTQVAVTPLCRPGRDFRCGRTTSTAGRVPATCSWPVSR